MEQIGYSLVHAGAEVQYWGDIAGQCVGVPSVLNLPNGDQVYCAPVGGTFSGYTLVPRYLTFDGASAATIASDKVTVHRDQPATVQTIEFVGLVRFTVAAGSVTVTSDTVGIGSVLRISAGRYRVYSQNSSPETMLPKVTVLDTAVKNARIRMRTAAYVEVSVVDGSNIAADATEVILELNRIVTS